MLRSPNLHWRVCTVARYGIELNRSRGDPQSDSRETIAGSELSEEGTYLLRKEIPIYADSLVTCYYTTTTP
jgi:hypothetical protein